MRAVSRNRSGLGFAQPSIDWAVLNTQVRGDDCDLDGADTFKGRPVAACDGNRFARQERTGRKVIGSFVVQRLKEKRKKMIRSVQEVFA
jgi:hypothetical protein